MSIDRSRIVLPPSVQEHPSHGGAWRTGAVSELTFLAEPFVRAGASFAVLDFINVDDAGGNLFLMVEQVRRAVG